MVQVAHVPLAPEPLLFIAHRGQILDGCACAGHRATSLAWPASLVAGSPVPDPHPEGGAQSSPREPACDQAPAGAWLRRLRLAGRASLRRQDRWPDRRPAGRRRTDPACLRALPRTPVRRRGRRRNAARPRLPGRLRRGLRAPGKPHLLGREHARRLACLRARHGPLQPGLLLGGGLLGVACLGLLAGRALLPRPG